MLLLDKELHVALGVSCILLPVIVSSVAWLSYYANPNQGMFAFHYFCLLMLIPYYVSNILYSLDVEYNEFGLVSAVQFTYVFFRFVRAVV